MEIFVTLLLSFAVFALIVWGFMHMRTPRFRMDRKQFLELLEDVIAGQADENEWQVLISRPVRHDPELEQLRRDCLAVEGEEYTGGSPHLFTRAGINRLREVRRRLLAIGIEKQSDQ